MTTLANRLFNHKAKKKTLDRAEAELEALLTSAGVPFTRLGWDHYDGSVEIYGVPPDYRLSPDAQRAVHQAGFIKAYVNHDSPERWETHYNFHPMKEFAESKGWRVSYPHKRESGDDKAIWVEEFIEGWPKEWFDTGYCVVKTP